MKQSKKSWLLFWINALVVGLVIGNVTEYLRLCSQYYLECRGMEDAIGQPLALLSLSALFIVIIHFFIEDHIFLVWRKFAIRYLPAAFVLLLLNYNSYEGGSFGPNIGIIPDPEAALWIATVLFIVISFFIIVRESIKLKKQQGEEGKQQ